MLVGKIYIYISLKNSIRGSAKLFPFKISSSFACSSSIILMARFSSSESLSTKSYCNRRILSQQGSDPSCACVRAKNSHCDKSNAPTNQMRQQTKYATQLLCCLCDSELLFLGNNSTGCRVCSLYAIGTFDITFLEDKSDIDGMCRGDVEYGRSKNRNDSRALLIHLSRARH
jgi:hypothetical protein